MKIRRGGFAFLWAIPLWFQGADAASPPVKVTLQSSWPTAPPIIEILETISLQNESAFFPLLDVLTDPQFPPTINSLTLEAVHQLAMETALVQGALKDSTALSFANMYLALHAATPKIEAYYQYYNDRHGERELEDLFSNSTGCGSWVDWYGKVVCDLETLVHLVDVDTIDSGNSNISYSRPKLLPFDHVYPSPKAALKPPARTAILYASTDSQNFRDLHSHLWLLSNSPSPRIEYVLRHVPPTDRNFNERDCLSGYGVALDLKKMDYLALDDRNQGNGNDKRDIEHATDSPLEEDFVLALLQDYPEKDSFDSTSPLTPGELSEIGVQAAQLIFDSPNALTTLKQLSQDFPKYATSIARRVVPKTELRNEIRSNGMRAQFGVNAVWLNGASIPETQMNPFSLLKLLRREREVILSLISLGLKTEEAVDLVFESAISTAQRDVDSLDGLFDASDRPEDGDVIIWWNDIEKDARYANWNPSLSLLLRPVHQGQFQSLKRNLFNVVLAVDLSRLNTISFISGSVSTIINRQFPFRFGVVPIVDTEESARMARLFYYMIEVYGRAPTMQFLKRVSDLSPPQSIVKWSIVRSEFDRIVADNERLREDLGTDFNAIVNGVAKIPLEKVQAYCKRLGVSSLSSSKGDAFVNGRHIGMDDNFLRYLQVEIGNQLQVVQQMLYTGKLSDNIGDASVYFYDLPTSSKRRNMHIHPTNQPGSLRVANLPGLFSRTGFSVQPGSFVNPPDAGGPALLAAYIIADFDTESGLSLVKEALNSLDSSSLTRVAFIHNPLEIPDDLPLVSSLISYLHTEGLFSKASPSLLLKALGLESSMSFDEGPQTVISKAVTIDDLTEGASLKDISRDTYMKYFTSCQLVAREIGFKPGEQGLIVNGRIIGPIRPGDIEADDFTALEEFELSKRVIPVVEALQGVVEAFNSYDPDSYSEIVSMSSSIISAMQLPDPDESILQNAQPRFRRSGYMQMDRNYTSFQFGNDSTALLHIEIVMDPLSEAAQRWSSLLEWLLKIPSVYMELHIHPSQYNDVPLKRFYRYNLESSPSYDEDGRESLSQTVFSGLPLDPIYTLGMDVPQSWLVRPREALHDLDNIQLNTIPREDRTKGLEAIFGLDYLIVEGHARDALTQTPPRGLQLQLTDSNSTPIADTQVVLNLGYLQFRAKPGVFQLDIRPGLGRDIFTMESVGNEGWDSPSVEDVGNEITLISFDGLTLYPRLARIPGMEQAEVLPVAESVAVISHSPLQKIGSWFSSLLSKETDVALTQVIPQADINIFTVASGLLYERFASIMILSVLRNTNRTVKFWFIENFLSPSFLEFIPHFAKEYGFQYELVTYKWPSWLRAQKEKQRIIWAYKILFLDVLFPMDLKKVIFVDADQIVRVDLKELVDLDLHGAPYGYTPMGDDNTEMEGFRFWKTGYWSQFLRGMPYHISALYVIDLVRFRQIAAGDILRGHYQQLSADPASLANLDQDLPNNLQREVPIFSLPEDWLWCETWCSKDRLHRAKTIDLCQNPLTKEPKLARARQIPEWEEYDTEIARFAQRLAAEGRVRSDMAAADSNVLASAAAAGGGPVASTVEETIQEKLEEHELRDEL